MRTVRIGGAAALLAVILGCSGMQGMMPTGGFQTGADASRPASFPMPEPPGGTLVTSGEISVAGVSTATLSYELPAGDDSEVLDLYEKSMKDAGLGTERSDAAGSATLSGNSADGKTAWSAVISDGGGKRTLTLVVITR